MRATTHGGDGRRSLVVKIAGLVGGVGLYHEEIGRAAAAGFPVLAVDTDGDRADDPADGPLSFDRLAADIVRALDQAGAERALLWGTSFGCLVALATAARYPRRVAGLLLCFPPAPGWRPPAYVALYRWASRRKDPARAATRLFHAGFYLLNAWEFAYPAALARLGPLARASRDAATPQVTVLQKLGMLWEGDPRWTAGVAGRPCGIVASRWDTVVPVSGARRLAAAIPGAHLRILNLAGHAGAFSRPRTYGRLVVEELRRLEAG